MAPAAARRDPARRGTDHRPRRGIRDRIPAGTEERQRAAGAQLRPSLNGVHGGLALTQDTSTCSVQSGGKLQLGVQVTNQSAGPIRLGRIRTVLPLSGLRSISPAMGAVRAIGAVQVPDTLGPGDSTWLSVTVQVLVACPAPIPVQFAIGSTYAGEAATVALPGFPDLGNVPYSGCPSG